MEALLAEALADFEERSTEAAVPADARGTENTCADSEALQVGAVPEEAGVPTSACATSEPAPALATQACASSATGPPASTTASPAAAARGPSLPPQDKRVKSKHRVAAALPMQAPAGGIEAGAADGMSVGRGMDLGSHLAGPQLPPRVTRKTQAQKPLPPTVQALADDLMKLVEESGLGGDEGNVAGGLEEMLRMMGEQSAPGSSTGASSICKDHEGIAFRSAALKGLAEQTKQTVNKQSKFQRGEGEGSRQGSTTSSAGGGFGAIGDILSALGPLAGGEGGGAGAAGGSMGFMVDYIMQNLLSKEVLYGPLKDIRDKYPPWLEEHRESLSADELQRYTAQYASIQAVCKQYEDDPSEFQRLVALIQQMQTYGDPPSDIVDEMTGGMPEGLMGEPGEPSDVGNFELPPEFASELPQELRDKCCIQ